MSSFQRPSTLLKSRSRSPMPWRLKYLSRKPLAMRDAPLKVSTSLVGWMASRLFGMPALSIIIVCPGMRAIDISAALGKNGPPSVPRSIRLMLSGMLSPFEPALTTGCEWTLKYGRFCCCICVAKSVKARGPALRSTPVRWPRISGVWKNSLPKTAPSLPVFSVCMRTNADASSDGSPKILSSSSTNSTLRDPFFGGTRPPFWKSSANCVNGFSGTPVFPGQ
jgi:hypothetical protein